MKMLKTESNLLPAVCWDGLSIEMNVSRLLHSVQRVVCRAQFTLLLAHEAEEQQNADAHREARRQATALLGELQQLDRCLVAARSVLFRALMKMQQATAASVAYSKSINPGGNY